MKILDQELRRLLKEHGIKYFFPVQATVIPYIIDAHNKADIFPPRDVCISSPTGSGKTLTFVLPIIHKVKQYSIKKVRALVILPTQDLAAQVYDTFKKYSQNTSIVVSLISKKTPFAQEQKSLVKHYEGFGFVSKVDIIVCTAGRLVDHLKSTEGFNLKNVEFLVIDEADRVLSSVQNDWLYHLEKHIYNEETFQSMNVLNLVTLKKRKPLQKLLFSATLSQDPEKLQQISLFQPKLFTAVMETEGNNATGDTSETFIGKYTTPLELTEKYVVTSVDLKPLVLFKFISKEKLTQTLVFTHSIESVHRLKVLLEFLSKNSLRVEEVSSKLSPNGRSEMIERFSNKEIDILVCTDSLARGMDLPEVQCVISYTAPKYIKTYIHRAGRTARAGKQGLAVTLLHENQVKKFKNLLSQAGKANIEEVTIPEKRLEKYSDIYKKALQQLKSKIMTEDLAYLKKAKNMKLSRKRKRSVTDEARDHRSE